jgi:four helix bundle protein
VARLTAFAFEKLVVYQKSVDFADEICRKTEQFPRGFGFLVDQLNRAALSIATNLAEGNGRFAKPDRRTFFGIARGSVQECVSLLELALRRGLLDENAHGMLKSRLDEIARMLSRLIKGLVHFAPPLIAWPMGLTRERQPAECCPIMRVFFSASRRARRNDGWPLRRSAPAPFVDPRERAGKPRRGRDSIARANRPGFADKFVEKPQRGEIPSFSIPHRPLIEFDFMTNQPQCREEATQNRAARKILRRMDMR